MQAVVRLPFANVQRLAAAAQEADPNELPLTKADEVSCLCNSIGMQILCKTSICVRM